MSVPPSNLPITEPVPVSQEVSPVVTTPVSSDIPNAPTPEDDADQGSDTHTKVLLQNLPKNFNNVKLMEALKKHRIRGVKVTGSESGSIRTLVCPDKNTAYKVVRLTHRGRISNAKQAKALILAKPSQGKQQVKNDEEGEVEERIVDQKMPLPVKPYEEQLKDKHRVLSKLMSEMTIFGLKREAELNKCNIPDWAMDNIQQMESNFEILRKEALRQRYQAYQEQNIPIPRYMSQKYPELLSEFAGSHLPANQALPESATMETESGAITAEIPYDPVWKEKCQAIRAQYPLPPRINPPCPVFPTVASPVHTGFHNKSEFTFGVTRFGDISIGFNVGSFGNGLTQVSDIAHCVRVSPRAVQLVQKMRNYVRNVSPHPVYNRCKKSGVWRLFVTRTQASGEDMVIVQYNPTNLSDEEQQAIRDDLKRLFSTPVEGFAPVTSLYIQETPDRTDEIPQNNSLVLLDGAPLIHETLLDTQFQISPHSIFPVNTLGAERFYSIVRDWAMGKPSPLLTPTTEGIADSASSNESSDVLLDLCCGRGTIGILMAKYFRQVVGIDVDPQAVEEANSIATAKGITNAKFIAGPIEKILNTQLQQLKADGVITDSSSVVAVLDPPGKGVNTKAVCTIRWNRNINRVIFVASDFARSHKSVGMFCKPRSMSVPGFPFRCVQAVPVDLFPHTKNCVFLVELVRSGPKAKTPDTSMLQ
ncbi:hypothetical protein IWQ62_005456 [Dispira parvispora]|uniref:Methyltransferase domain-containing protein n=1 Tax=Dispira parvispora TaxID=1520584 RepID=A0A9W8E4I1_9FUNG|nr:hypothetical protein IWQ62_005456 [Dispira parvispora]